MTEQEYLNQLAQQESAKQPSLIPIPSINVPNQQHNNSERPPQLSREPSPEEKINMMGQMLGVAMQGAVHSDSAYVELGNPQGFTERAAARNNLRRIAENLDKQKEAIRRGQQTTLKPVNIPVVPEPVIPNFVPQQSTPINQPSQYQIQTPVDYQHNQIHSTPTEPQMQMEFDFHQTTLDDVMNEIDKVNNKINDLFTILQNINTILVNKNKKKLK